MAIDKNNRKSESDCLKKKICESCMEELKNVFTDNQLKRFEERFYNAFAGVILKEKGESA